MLGADAVRAITTDHLTAQQREAGRIFLEGQGWGYGGSVDVDASDPMTQRELTGPASTQLFQEFWTYAAGS